MNPEPPILSSLPDLPHSPEAGIRSPGTDEFFATLGLDIQKHGWLMHGAHVPALDVDYVYTIGLIERGCQTEVMIAGMPMETATALVNEIAVEMTTGGGVPPSTWTMVPNQILRGILHLPRPGAGLALDVARAYYQTPAVMVAQYVWPDANGNYPWDEGWDSNVRQPTPLRRWAPRIEG